jgi:hypothetical protein
MIPIFLLTYNEADFFVEIYNDDFINKNFVPNDVCFYVLDNGKQDKIKSWCERNNYIYYASEYNIGSAGGYNWMFKVAYNMGLTSAIIMQADVEVSSVWPLLYTYRLTTKLGKTHLIVWPQITNCLNNHKPFDNEVPNLGNLVGFNPWLLHKKNCYFDDNYVVTHFDDLEYISYIKDKISILNAAWVLGDTDQSFTLENLPAVDTTVKTFVITHFNEYLKIHHASMAIDAKMKSIENSHGPWYDFNKPYFDLVSANHGKRLPYDPNRWKQFGYPEFPVTHEIERFFKQYPSLLINKISK